MYGQMFFNKSVKTIQWGKQQSILKKNGIHKTGYPINKTK